jgi:recombinational DNA repair ATPase RecF
MKKETKKTITKKSATRATRGIKMDDIIKKNEKEQEIKKLVCKEEAQAELKSLTFIKTIEKMKAKERKLRAKKELIDVLSGITAFLLKLVVFYWAVNIVADAVIRILG